MRPKKTDTESQRKEVEEKMEVEGEENMEGCQPRKDGTCESSWSDDDNPTAQQTTDALQKTARESEEHGDKEMTQPEAMDIEGHNDAHQTVDAPKGHGDPNNTEQKAGGKQGNEDSQEALGQPEVDLDDTKQKTGGNQLNEDSIKSLYEQDEHGTPNVKKQKGRGKPNANTSTDAKQKAVGRQGNGDSHAAPGKPTGRGGRNVAQHNAGVKQGNGDSHAAPGGPTGRGGRNVAQHNAGVKQGTGDSHAASGGPTGRGGQNVAKQNAGGKPKVSSPKLTDIPGISEQSRKTPKTFNQQHHDEIHNYTSGSTHGGSQVHGHDHNQSIRGQRHDQSHGHASGGQWGMYSMRDQQMQDHIFREAQASKQMVYEVYGNCITMLEEMESRTLKKKGHKALPRSDIYLPDQKKFDDKTIQRKLDTQLILLQCQLTSCNDEIKDEVKDKLKECTINWGSQREDKKIPNGLTDDYTQKLFELLDKGKTDHPKEFDESPTIGEKDMQNALGAIMQGQQKQSDLDKSFKKDPKKKASGPNMRQTAGVDKGADRIVRGRKDFERSVDNHRSSLL